MPLDLSRLLVIGISSRALFDLEEEERIYQRLGIEKYRQYQLDNEEEILNPGTAFPFVKGLLSLNKPGEEQRVEVIIISRNNPETGLRIFHSIKHHSLAITRAAFAGGESLPPYLEAFGVDLFLSRSPEDAQQAIDAGFAAAFLYKQPAESPSEVDKLRIAFDGDAVLFSEESEAIFKAKGMEAFFEHESLNADTPLNEGPFAKLLKKLSVMQAGLDPEDSPVRIAIVTARNSPAHERVIKTLRNWNVRVDAAFFLGGVPKDKILKAFGAQMFFDDQDMHVAFSSLVVPSALVPYRTHSVLRAPPVDSTGTEPIKVHLPEAGPAGQNHGPDPSTGTEGGPDREDETGTVRASRSG